MHEALKNVGKECRKSVLLRHKKGVEVVDEYFVFITSIVLGISLHKSASFSKPLEIICCCITRCFGIQSVKFLQGKEFTLLSTLQLRSSVQRTFYITIHKTTFKFLFFEASWIVLLTRKLTWGSIRHFLERVSWSDTTLPSSHHSTKLLLFSVQLRLLMELEIIDCNLFKQKKRDNKLEGLRKMKNFSRSLL